jgi:hypothetical protein
MLETHHRGTVASGPDTREGGPEKRLMTSRAYLKRPLRRLDNEMSAEQLLMLINTTCFQSVVIDCFMISITLVALYNLLIALWMEHIENAHAKSMSLAAISPPALLEAPAAPPACSPV